jgi:O-antigen chain-terminating methyltransferase
LEQRVEAQRAYVAQLQQELRVIGERLSGLPALEQRVDTFGRELVKVRRATRPIAYRNASQLANLNRSETTYRSFERIFRGTPKLLQTRYPYYLRRLPAQGLVLDVGCGTGELLAWLAQAGIQAEGVDIDVSNVAEARSKGVEVLEGDAVDYLMRHPARYSAILSVQLVEHLAPNQLPVFFEVAMKALLPNGVLMTETVNPYNPQQFQLFSLDPTHTRPIFPELLEFYLAKVGFESIETEYLACFGEPRAESELETPWDYCDYLTVAHKPLSTELDGCETDLLC